MGTKQNPSPYRKYLFTYVIAITLLEVSYVMFTDISNLLTL